MSQLVGLPPGTYSVQVVGNKASNVELGGTTAPNISIAGYTPQTGDALQTFIGANILAITHIYYQNAFQPLLYNPGSASFTCKGGTGVSVPYATAQGGTAPTPADVAAYDGNFAGLHFAVTPSQPQQWWGKLGWTLSLTAANSDPVWGESALQELGASQNTQLKVSGSAPPMPWIQINEYVSFGDGMYWRIGAYNLSSNLPSHNNCSGILSLPGQIGLQVSGRVMYAGSPAAISGTDPVYATTQTNLDGTAATQVSGAIPSEIAALVATKFYQPKPMIATLAGPFPVTTPLMAPAIPVSNSQDALAVWQVAEGTDSFVFSPRWPALGIGCCIVELQATTLTLYTDDGSTVVNLPTTDSGPNAYAWLYMHDTASGYVVAGGWSNSAFVARPNAFLSEDYWLQQVKCGPLSLGTGGAVNYTTLTAYQAVCQMNRGGMAGMDVPQIGNTPFSVGVPGVPQGAACDNHMTQFVCGSPNSKYNPQTCCVYTSQIAQALGGQIGIQAAACFQNGCAQTATAGATSPGTGGAGYVPYSVTTCIGQNLCLNVEGLSGNFNTNSTNQTIYCGSGSDTTYIYIGLAVVVGLVLFWWLVIK